MFLLFDSRLQPVFTKYLGFTEDILHEMKSGYFDALQKLQINELFAYIEEKGMQAESDYIDQLSDTSIPREKQLENLENLFRYINEFGLEHTDFQERVNAKTKELNSDLLDGIFSKLPANALAEIGELMVDDMKAMLEIKKHNPDFQLPERLQNFQ